MTVSKFENTFPNSRMDRIQVAVKTINNDTYNFNVDPALSVERFKRMIKSESSVDEERQRLIYRGRVLTDNTTLQDYKLENGHTIHMVIRPDNFREIQTVPEPPVQERTPIPTRRRNPTPAPAVENGSNLEHIRQGMLTMSTLLSTMSSDDIGHLKDRRMIQFTPGAENDSELVQLSAARPQAGDRKFFRGQWIDVKDTVAQWLEATIMDIDEQNKSVFIHYNGWPERWDEWIPWDSLRISPFRSRTTHSAINPYATPCPNIVAVGAPRTGSNNDPRSLVPEMANLLNMIQPAFNELAVLTEEVRRLRMQIDSNGMQSLLSSPPATTTAGGAPTRTMPWDMNVIEEQHRMMSCARNSSSSISMSFYSQLRRHNSKLSTVDFDTKLSAEDVEADAQAKGAGDDETDVEGKEHGPREEGVRGKISGNARPAMPLHAKKRLKHLANELCPLVDRFGRLLTDLSPILQQIAQQDAECEGEGQSTHDGRPQQPSGRTTRNTPAEPDMSLEASIMRLLTGRPVSPPPEVAFRSPIVTQGRAAVAGPGGQIIQQGAVMQQGVQTRNSALPEGLGNILSDLTSSLANGRAPANGTAGAALPRAPMGVDIHIAILSPPQRTRRIATPPTAPVPIPQPPVQAPAASAAQADASPSISSSIERMSNLSNSLHAQAQALAARSQQLNERTTAVTEYSNALTEMMRTVSAAEEIRQTRRRIVEITNQLAAARTVLAAETNNILDRNAETIASAEAAIAAADARAAVIDQDQEDSAADLMESFNSYELSQDDEVPYESLATEPEAEDSVLLDDLEPPPLVPIDGWQETLLQDEHQEAQEDSSDRGEQARTVMYDYDAVEEAGRRKEQVQENTAVEETNTAHSAEQPPPMTPAAPATDSGTPRQSNSVRRASVLDRIRRSLSLL